MKIGDTVKYKKPVKYSIGRITGFAPNGRARVSLPGGRQRIWSPSDLVIVNEAVDQSRHIDDWLFYKEVEAFANSLGQERLVNLMTFMGWRREPNDARTMI